MSQKQINAAFKKHRASLSVVCKQCQSSHRRRGFYLRRRDKAAPSGPETLTKLQVVSAMYAYLMTSWEELPDKSKRALGFDFAVGSEGEEAALNHLARLFMEYADLSFRRALVARRRRLGLDAYSGSAFAG